MRSVASGWGLFSRSRARYIYQAAGPACSDYARMRALILSRPAAGVVATAVVVAAVIVGIAARNAPTPDWPISWPPGGGEQAGVQVPELQAEGVADDRVGIARLPGSSFRPVAARRHRRRGRRHHRSGANSTQAGPQVVAIRPAPVPVRPVGSPGGRPRFGQSHGGGSSGGGSSGGGGPTGLPVPVPTPAPPPAPPPAAGLVDALGGLCAPVSRLPVIGQAVGALCH
jgi:uncharacterized membrane protein YgcG